MRDGEGGRERQHQIIGQFHLFFCMVYFKYFMYEINVEEAYCNSIHFDVHIWYSIWFSFVTRRVSEF